MQFEEYRVIHCFGEHWNFDAYAARAHTQSFKETAASFRQDMHQLNKVRMHPPRARLPLPPRMSVSQRPAVWCVRSGTVI